MTLYKINNKLNEFFSANLGIASSLYKTGLYHFLASFTVLKKSVWGYKLSLVTIFSRGYWANL